MKYPLDKKLEQFKQIWLTKEIWQLINEAKIKFNRENKKSKQKISLAKLANNCLAEKFNK
ncbi:hypothetical protein HN569_00605 [bacterium]|jgi:hypothetical protein|nr:hypothetical protein [archaeon]MBT7992333.1 hypothetical protein [bacterium]